MNQKLTATEEILATMSAIGVDPQGGMTRLLFDAYWKEAQETLRVRFEEAGLTATYDAAGNLIGSIAGSEKPEETIMTGSHVDTVRNGGTLDGQYGILAGFLAIQRLIEKHGTPKRSLSVVSFAEEEGSRFPFVFWGSKNLIGSVDRSLLAQVIDQQGIGFPQAMKDAGFDFSAPPSAPRTDIVAFVEAHIEQGAVLEHLEKQVGVVTAITGQKRYNICLTGEANHAGTTPMQMRKDALEGAARIMVALLDEAKRLGDPLVLTFGKLEPKPNIVNVVPGEVNFTVDTRHPDQKALNDFAAYVEATIQSIAGSANLQVSIDNWMDEAPVPMDTALVELFKTSCTELGIDYHVMHSGAGHDSQIMAPCVPTAMLFVPSKKGISHNPAEDTEMEDLLAGIDVLEAALYHLAY
ncbi:MAG: allantoate deiminase [Coriobacteriia bacterium]|jgi:allantoate deiminase|nr:allantoate deiminase [Coriobacteriia bacterium]